LSCWAGGAITDRLTRGSEEVKALRFPVFTNRTVCTDVRGRATVDTINRHVVDYRSSKIQKWLEDKEFLLMEDKYFVPPV